MGRPAPAGSPSPRGRVQTPALDGRLSRGGGLDLEPEYTTVTLGDALPAPAHVAREECGPGVARSSDFSKEAENLDRRANCANV